MFHVTSVIATIQRLQNRVSFSEFVHKLATKTDSYFQAPYPSIPTSAHVQSSCSTQPNVQNLQAPCCLAKCHQGSDELDSWLRASENPGKFGSELHPESTLYLIKMLQHWASRILFLHNQEHPNINSRYLLGTDSYRSFTQKNEIRELCPKVVWACLGCP